MLNVTSLLVAPSARVALVCRVYRHGLNTFRQPLPGQLVRSFRSGTQNGASIRSRFGRSQPKNTDGSSSQSLALDTGRLALAAGAALGLGGLCYYGLSMTPSRSDSNAMSALDRATAWPDYVRERIHSTYAYLAGGAGIAAGSAALLARSPAFTRLMMGSGLLAPIGMMVASVVAGVVCQTMPYPASGLGAKHLAWVVFSASIGGMLVPVCFVAGPIVSQAAVYTGGIVTGLSIVAATAPSDKFLKWGGPLAIGLGVVVVSSLGSMFLSPASRLGSGLSAISLYGGLLLFSGFLLYDTQMMVRRAELHPPPPPPPAAGGRFPSPDYGGLNIQQAQNLRPFDPINNSIQILMDVVNIFVRMVAILSGGQRRK